MILVGIGSNLAASGFASAQDTAAAAVMELPDIGVTVAAASRWYLSEPVPASDQPWFVNAVVVVATALTPEALLGELLALEDRFGRRRGVRNAARTLDLDLLDYDGRLYDSDRLALPHPRLHQRRFVLTPIAEVAPAWRHPRLGVGAVALLDRLPPGQPIRLFGDTEPLRG